MNERLKELRKLLGLNQTEFGKRLGVGNTTISKIEIRENNLTEQMITSVCREFGANEEWLRTGRGEILVVTENTLINQLSEQYGLDSLDRLIIEKYVTLPRPHREAIKFYVRDIAQAFDGGADAEHLQAIEPTADTRRVFRAAQKKDGTEGGYNPPGYTNIPASALDKLKNAPPVEEI